MASFFAVFGDDKLSCRATDRYQKPFLKDAECFVSDELMGHKNCFLVTHALASPTGAVRSLPLRLSKYPHVMLVACGTIYNSADLAKMHSFVYETSCELEAIIHLYERFGPREAACWLDGEFAFLLLDAEKEIVIMCRDPFGMKPLFTLFTEDCMLAVSSEMKAIVYPEKASASHYIKEVLPSTYAVYKVQKNGKVTLEISEKYTNFLDIPKHSKLLRSGIPGFQPNATDYDIIKSNIRILLEDAVRKRIPKDAKMINCLASGGLDSSIICGLLSKVIEDDKLDISLRSYTVGMIGAPDLENGRIVASHIGSKHDELIYSFEQAIEKLDEIVRLLETYDITTIRASTPMFFLANHIRRHSESIYIMCGEGSDEVAQGYVYFKNAPSAEEAHKESVRLLEEVYKFDVIRCDRTTAINGLVPFAPFLDHTFVAYFMSLDPKLRIPKDGIEKFLLRDAFTGTGIVPERLLWRAKEAFSDGVSPYENSWWKILFDHFETVVTDEEFSKASELFPYLTPTTKESFHYRKVFEMQFPKCERILSSYWLPKWVKGSDPSARTWVV